MPESAPARVQAVGLFLASEEPARLTAWYRALGVALGDEGYGIVGGDGSPGSGSVFSVQPATTALPPSPKEAIEDEPYGRRRVTINLRVDDLAAVVAGLRGRGDAVAGPKDYGYGLFAWVQDPDGNVVEMWEAGRGTG